MKKGLGIFVTEDEFDLVDNAHKYGLDRKKEVALLVKKYRLPKNTVLDLSNGEFCKDKKN